ncbi:MAG TPA: phosphoribosylformylglycinamidine synthase subunit PurL, partial [Flavisolibacter sp.]
AFLFGEAQSRVIVTVAENEAGRFTEYLERSGLSFGRLGTVTSGEIRVDDQNWGSIEEWKELYDTAIEKKLAKELESEGALGML